MTFTLSQPTRSELIRRINDQCRAAFTASAILVTAAFDQLDRKTKALALHRVRTFKDFDADNDPHQMIRTTSMTWRSSTSMGSGTSGSSTTSLPTRSLDLTIPRISRRRGASSRSASHPITDMLTNAKRVYFLKE
jgi:hypothetical protein